MFYCMTVGVSVDASLLPRQSVCALGRVWEQDYVDTCLCRASAVFDTVLGGGGGAGSVGAG